jgi:hypothetical protein
MKQCITWQVKVALLPLELCKFHIHCWGFGVRILKKFTFSLLITLQKLFNDAGLTHLQKRYKALGLGFRPTYIPMQSIFFKDHRRVRAPYGVYLHLNYS